MKYLLTRYDYANLNIKFFVDKKYAKFYNNNNSELEPIYLNDFVNRFPKEKYFLRSVYPAHIRFYEQIDIQSIINTIYTKDINYYYILKKCDIASFFVSPHVLQYVDNLAVIYDEILYFEKS